LFDFFLGCRIQVEKGEEANSLLFVLICVEIRFLELCEYFCVCDLFCSTNSGYSLEEESLAQTAQIACLETAAKKIIACK